MVRRHSHWSGKETRVVFPTDLHGLEDGRARVLQLGLEMGHRRLLGSNGLSQLATAEVQNGSLGSGTLHVQFLSTYTHLTIFHKVGITTGEAYDNLTDVGLSFSREQPRATSRFCRSPIDGRSLRSRRS